MKAFLTWAASQDSRVRAATNGEYMKLGVVLSEGTNEENKKIALDWWNKHKGIWE